MIKTAIFLNIINIIGLVFVWIISAKKKPVNFIADVCLFLSIILGLFTFLLLGLSFYTLMKYHNYVNSIIYLLFAVSPFIIGNLATYKKANLYTSIQFLFFALSLGFLASNL